MRLLTRTEYNHTVRDLLADNTRPADAFPLETQVLGLDNNADMHLANPTLVERYLNAAEDVAARAVADTLGVLLPCDVSVEGAAVCGQRFVDVMGPAAFRRPLTAGERNALGQLFDTAHAAWGYTRALELVLQALLQAPQFLYRLEFVPVGAATAVPVDGWAMASRLSYLVWASMPDPVLLQAAAANQLGTAAQIETQVRRMMADSRAKDGLGNFFRQWLEVDSVAGVAKDTTLFPAFTPALRQSWQEGLRTFVDDVLWNGTGTLTELLTRRALAVDAAMAPIYGVTPPLGMVMVDAPERAGILTQPGLMALLAHPDQSAPVRRGKFVRERLMCEHINPPPPGLVVTPPDLDPNLTTRERFAEHTISESCRTCHIRMDPVGFGFEGFDAMGAWRTEENGLPIDMSGEMLLVEEDENLEGPFDGADGLADALAASPQVRGCAVRQAFRYAMGRVEGPQDTCVLGALRAAFETSGGNIRELWVHLAVSTAYRTAAAPVEVP